MLRNGGDAESAVAGWDPTAEPSREISFMPARVLLQDFTGVPAVVDLAAMRDAMRDQGGDPAKINPLIPAELVIDHSVQVDEFATRLAIERNVELEFERNRERYAFLRWGQQAFDTLEVVPPNTGICHQVNLEYLARVVESRDGVAFPDTVVGTDSHTTMVNGLGVLGWGVGGIEAEAAMLGEAVSMLVPQVVGFRLTGALREGATATDLVLTVTEILRRDRRRREVRRVLRARRAVARARRPRDAREHEPRVRRDVRLLPGRRRDARLPAAHRPARTSASRSSRRTARRTCSGTSPTSTPTYSQVVELDLDDVEPSIAGPRRPQDRVPLARAKEAFIEALGTFGVEYENGTYDKEVADSFPASDPPTFDGVSDDAPRGARRRRGEERVAGRAATDFALEHGSVVIAAITSCTNTSNPSVMIAAGLLAKKAVERGLTRKPWVKSSLAPGSKVVTEYYERAGLDRYLDELGFNTVGYGCTTCIGNSGPLPEEISAAIAEGDLVVCAVLSGNRNFEARIHGEVKANYLASPPLVVAYALAGRMDIDLVNEPIGDGDGVTSTSATSGRRARRSTRRSPAPSTARCSRRRTRTSTPATTGGARSRLPPGELYEWDPDSTYVRLPPYFDGMPARARNGRATSTGARCLVVLGDSVTTDHISPAGAIRPDSPAGQYLVEHGVERRDFNSYGSRRGNHEVMVRGTFANVRLRNQLVAGQRGHVDGAPPGRRGDDDLRRRDALPRGGRADDRHRRQGVRIGLVARLGGEGAEPPRRPAAIAESYERIHRSNLLMMGILPLQFMDGENRESLGLTGREEFSIVGVENGDAERGHRARGRQGVPCPRPARHAARA